MIDKVKMNTIVEIPLAALDPTRWRRFNNRGNPLYTHKQLGVTFCYSVRASRLSVLGRLYNLSDNPNRIGNLDLLYEGMAGIRIEQEEQVDGSVRYYAESYTQNLDQLIDQTNAYINNLLNITVDIRTFKVTYIEFCFNLYTPYVAEYVRMFNRVFNEHPHKSYTSHVQRQGLEDHTSFYIRSNAQYRDGNDSRYTINFYNKLNQLDSLIMKAHESNRDFGPERFGDATLAFNLLRMEVKVGHIALNNLYDKKKLDRPFWSFLSPEVGRDIIVKQYEKLVGHIDNDFKSYYEACRLIRESDYTDSVKNDICEFLLNYMKHQKKPCKNTKYKYWKLLRALGIHWCAIPTAHGISSLESPIALLDRHISDLEENRENMTKRFFITELEAVLYNAIEVEEEEIMEIPDEILGEL